jgi:hypothetical protein
MGAHQLYTPKWTNLITGFNEIPHGMMKPGNFYKISVYRYADPEKTKVLSGVDTAYIFFIGRYITNGKVHFSALKLKHVSPEKFFDSIRTAMDRIDEKKIDESIEFRLLLKHFPKDGRPLFNLIKRVPIIYHDNYREYLMTSIKNVSLIDIDKQYLKSKFLPGYNKNKRVLERKEDLNIKQPVVKKNPPPSDKKIKDK